MNSAKQWSPLFSWKQIDACLPFIEGRDLKPSLNSEAIKKFFRDYQPSCVSPSLAPQSLHAVNPDRFNSKPRAVAWLVDRSSKDSEDETAKEAGHTTLSQSRGVINATGLLMKLEARTKELSTPYLEADRQLVYIHDLSDATLLALMQTSKDAAQRFNLSLYRPRLTLDHTGGGNKLTESDWRSLSWMYRSSGGRAGNGSENNRLKLGSEKGALEFLGADASYINPTSDFEKILQTTSIITGDNHSKWASWALIEPFEDDFEVLETENDEQEADRRMLLLDYDLEAETWARYRKSMNESQFTGVYRRGIMRKHLNPPRKFLAIVREHLCRNRHLKLAYTTLLTGAQLACIVPIQGYDISHGEPSTPQAPPIAGGPSMRLLRQLDLNLDFLTHPSTMLFVFFALAYGAVAMHQYSMNEIDRFQQLSLINGLVVGFWLSSPPLGELGAQRFVSSNLALAVTVALFVSAVGHWIYTTCWDKKECEESDIFHALENKVGGEAV